MKYNLVKFYFILKVKLISLSSFHQDVKFLDQDLITIKVNFKYLKVNCFRIVISQNSGVDKSSVIYVAVEMVDLLVSFAGRCHCPNVEPVLGVGFEAGQFGTGLGRVSDGRLALDLRTNLRLLHLLVVDPVASQVAVRLFRLLPDQVESRRAEWSRLKIINRTRT